MVEGSLEKCQEKQKELKRTFAKAFEDCEGEVSNVGSVLRAQVREVEYGLEELKNKVQVRVAMANQALSRQANLVREGECKLSHSTRAWLDQGGSLPGT
eukprot:895361-Karenia_brevis.AAC.1